MSGADADGRGDRSPRAGDADEAPARRARRRAMARLGGAGLLLAGGAARGVGEAEPPPSWRMPGGGFSNYGQPAPDNRTIRWIAEEPSLPGNGASWTPLHDLAGTVTPNGLHFERHHGGVPALESEGYALAVDGAVERPLALDLAALGRLRQRSRIGFIECGGNSASLWRGEPRQAPSGWLHGLVSSGEWSGVPLRALLETAGVRRGARWLIATGLDAAGVTVSLPLESLPADTLVALHRNGEALRPEHGWPARLYVPGQEGIVNVKWLGRLELATRPAMSRFDTVAYTDLGRDGRARRFSRTMGVKSVVTTPTVGVPVAPGRLVIGGLAWSGAGTVRAVEVSLDGGRRWAEAALERPLLDRAFTRFAFETTRAPNVALLVQSRARDGAGRVQPTREALLEARGRNGHYHYNAILTTAIDRDGTVRHVHA